MTEGSSDNRKKSGPAWDDVMAVVAVHCAEKFEVVPQSAFVKITGPQDHRMYVAKQEFVGRIDLAFTPRDADGKELPGLKARRKQNGKVECEIDTLHAAVLVNIEGILVWMSTAAPIAKQARAAFVPQVPAFAQRRAAAVAASRTPEQVVDDEQRKRELIERVAREKGVGVSPRAGLRA